LSQLTPVRETNHAANRQANRFTTNVPQGNMELAKRDRNPCEIPNLKQPPAPLPKKTSIKSLHFIFGKVSGLG
jgi:hypothetical protein